MCAVCYLFKFIERLVTKEFFVPMTCGVCRSTITQTRTVRWIEQSPEWTVYLRRIGMVYKLSIQTVFDFKVVQPAGGIPRLTDQHMLERYMKMSEEKLARIIAGAVRMTDESKSHEPGSPRKRLPRPDRRDDGDGDGRVKRKI